MNQKNDPLLENRETRGFRHGPQAARASGKRYLASA